MCKILPTCYDEEGSTEDLCLMAYVDEVTSEFNSLEDDSCSYDDFQNYFEEFS